MDVAARERRIPGRRVRLTARPRWLLGSGVLLLAAGLTWALLHAYQTAASRPPTRAELQRRVTVEVLNSTKVPGVARVGMLALRHAGLDVVYFGNADSALSGRQQSQVLVRRGDTTGVGRVIEALGQAVVIDAPDRARVVDLTVLIGADYVLAKPATRP